MEEKTTLEQLEQRFQKITLYLRFQINNLEELEKGKNENEKLWPMLDAEFYECLFKIHKAIHMLGVVNDEICEMGGFSCMHIADARHYRAKYRNTAEEFKEWMTEYVDWLNERLTFKLDCESEEYYISKCTIAIEQQIDSFGYDNPNDYDQLIEQQHLISSEPIEILNKLTLANQIISKCIDDDISTLEKIAVFDDESYPDDLLKYVMNLAKKVEPEVRKKLRNQAMKMKDKPSDVLSKNHWLKMLDREDEVLRLAAKGELKLSDDECIELYELRSLISKDDAPLIVGMLDVFISDELFDMNQFVHIYHLLYSGNIGLFVCLLLRGNIIRSELNDELKKEYEVWLHGNNTENTQLSESDLTSKLSETNKVINLEITLGGRSIVRDIVWLYNFLNEHCVQKIQNQCEWYAVYRFLIERGYLKDSTITTFATQMNVWYDKARIPCEASQLSRYNFLSGYKIDNWLTIPEKNLKPKTNMKSIMRIHTLYTDLIRNHDEIQH